MTVQVKMGRRKNLNGQMTTPKLKFKYSFISVSAEMWQNNDTIALSYFASDWYL